MGVTIEPMGCGTLAAGLDMFEAGGAADRITIPVPSYLVRHPDGIAVIDTGMSTALSTPGSFLDLISLFFEVGLDADTLLAAQLQQRQVDPADVDIAIVTHSHFDHSGGLDQLPNARVIIQAAELAAARDPELAAGSNLNSGDLDHGHDLVAVDGEHDVFGDGSVVCLPTPGHTPGHQSVRIRLDDAEVVVCGDCAYFERTLDGGPLPGAGHDLAEQARSIGRLRSLGAAGAQLIPGHDPAVFEALPARLG